MSISIGLIGAGNISETHARAAAAIPDVNVAAVWGQRAERAARVAETCGARAYTDLDAMLAHRPMSLVAIGSPSGVHADHAIAAIHHGLHTIVEKPLDVTTARIDAIADAARAAGVKVGVFFQDRVAPDLMRVKAAIDDGVVGKPVLASARVRWHRPPEYYTASHWRGKFALDGGGALMNQAIHTVDLLLWLFGPVMRVTAMTATRIHAIEVEDTAVATLEFESGALGVIEATTSVYPGYPRRVELTGAEGTVIIEGSRLVAADLRDPSRLPMVASHADGQQSAVSAVVSDIEGHRRLLEDFIDAIDTGREPICNAAEGRRSVAVIQAIYASARSGRAERPAPPTAAG